MNEIINNILIITDRREVQCDRHVLGIKGENEVEKLVFSMSEFIDGIGYLELKQDDEKKYIEMTKVDDTYELIVKNALLTTEEIELQVRILRNEKEVFKSEKFEMRIEEAINAEEELEDEYENVLDTLIIDVEKIKEQIEELDLETVIEKLANKVDKEEGKGLSSNDFTDEYKNKIDEGGGGGQKVIYVGPTEPIDSEIEIWIDTSENEEPIEEGIFILSDGSIFKTSDGKSFIVKEED